LGKLTEEHEPLRLMISSSMEHSEADLLEEEEPSLLMKELTISFEMTTEEVLSNCSKASPSKISWATEALTVILTGLGETILEAIVSKCSFLYK